MKQIKVNNKEYFFPQSWKEITIGKFERIQSLDKINDREYTFMLLSILGDIPVMQINNIKATELNELIAITEGILCSELKTKIYDEVELGGKKYVFRRRFGDISTAEFILLSEFTKNSKQNYGEICAIMLEEIEKTHKKIYLKKHILKIFNKYIVIKYPSIKKTYTVKPFDASNINEFAQTIRNELSIEFGFHIVTFFLNYWIISTRTLEEIKKIKSPKKKLWGIF